MLTEIDPVKIFGPVCRTRNPGCPTVRSRQYLADFRLSRPLNPPSPKLRILLLQARDSDDPVRDGERADFARYARLPVESFVPWDLLGGPPSLVEIRRYDALMVGGSGDYDVTKGNLPRSAELFDVLTEVAEVGHPTFASCFGFQCLVQALGGEIVHDSDRAEVGTFELELTPDGRRDPLFGILPTRFPAQLGHKERAETFPDGVLHLASSERARYQALRIPGRPVWATQFHPELGLEENRGRFERYLEAYTAFMTAEEVEETLERFRESRDVEGLIPRFLELIFG